MADHGNLSRKKPITDTTQNTAPSLDGFSSPKDFPALWQQAFDASPDMISILDNQHRIVSVNKAMAEIIQCAPSEARGSHCFQKLHGTDRPPRLGATGRLG